MHIHHYPQEREGLEMGDIEMSFCFYVKNNNIDLDLSWSEEVGFTNKKTIKRFNFYLAGFIDGQRG